MSYQSPQLHSEGRPPGDFWNIMGRIDEAINYGAVAFSTIMIPVILYLGYKVQEKTREEFRSAQNLEKRIENK